MIQQALAQLLDGRDLSRDEAGQAGRGCLALAGFLLEQRQDRTAAAAELDDCRQRYPDDPISGMGFGARGTDLPTRPVHVSPGDGQRRANLDSGPIEEGEEGTVGAPRRLDDATHLLQRQGHYPRWSLWGSLDPLAGVQLEDPDLQKVRCERLHRRAVLPFC